MHRRSRSGMALVYVLWVLVLLSAVAFEMAYRGHLRVQTTAASGDAAQSFYLARAGIEKAIADLVENADTVDRQFDLRENAADLYREVPLGNGTFTLFAGLDESGTPAFGMVDECAKVNIKTAEIAVLERLPGMSTGLATAIDTLRKQGEFRDLKDLYLLEGFDGFMLFGEDQNENGLLDSNENDGDQSWPPDNSDGELDRGLSQYLTVWSAARNVDSTGEPRVNLNKGEAAELRAALSEISEQQAESIVAHRQKGQISSPFDLLDVELVEKVAEQQGGQNPAQPNQPPQGNQEAQGREQQPNEREARREQRENERSRPRDQANNDNAGGDGQRQPGQAQGQQPTTRGTGQKAFDESAVQKLADRVTVEDDDVLVGRINVNTAPFEVLACLPGLDESLAQAIINERESKSGGLATVADLLDVNGMSTDKIKQVYKYLTFRSDTFSVNSFGVLRQGAVYASVTAVLDRSGDEVRILHWQEND